MSKTGASRGSQWVKQMPDVVLSQANPVSGTWYPVLAITSLCKIKQACLTITWATTQPTPIRIRITVDGIPITHSFANPVSGTAYSLTFNTPYADETAQNLVATPVVIPYFYEGKTISVDINATWATTQPTPLVCRVKYMVLA